MKLFPLRMNSRPGTSFTTIDIIEVIQACGRNNVSSIKLQGVEITFSSTAPTIERPVSPEITRAQDRLDKANLLKDEDRLKDDQLTNMLVEDPGRYEEFLAQGELVDEDRRP